MKIFIDDAVLREMSVISRARLFEVSANDTSLANGHPKQSPASRLDTARNGVELVGDIASIFSNYRIETEILGRQVSPRRKKSRRP
jgi:hypothetical protein